MRAQYFNHEGKIIELDKVVDLTWRILDDETATEAIDKMIAEGDLDNEDYKVKSITITDYVHPDLGRPSFDMVGDETLIAEVELEDEDGDEFTQLWALNVVNYE